jgi:glycogen debranching enzyme GlgX/4-alpha-glucanotransferase
MLQAKNILQGVNLQSLEIKIEKGKCEPFGANIVHSDDCGNGVNFSVYSKNASAIMVYLFDDKDNEIAQIPLLNKTGDIFHAFAYPIPKNSFYALRVYGEYNPKHGNWFDSSKLLIDPYCLEIDRPFIFDPSLCKFGADTKNIIPKGKICTQILANPKSNIPIEEIIIYEMHIAGFTKNLAQLPNDERGRFKGLGSDIAIKYLKELGINAVEILPAAAWINEKHLFELGLENYWGYNPICFMAPDPKLAPNGWQEVRECVKNLEENGIETIIDVVFNHSGEGDKFGPTLSMRGIDNKTYYRIDDNSEYSNEAGCGNVIDCANPNTIRLILSSMRAWRNFGGVHGFRFDLASILGRNLQYFDKAAPLLNAINNDPILCKLKLIAEPWDCAGYNIGQFPHNFCEWNDKYRDIMRQFWLGETQNIGDFITRFCGSSDIFAQFSPCKSVNFITAHDGFSLQDLVSFNHKNNLQNGENNRDGSDNNYSFNHGQESASENQDIIKARNQSVRNLLTSLLFSRGIPMLAMGCEIGKSQNGNNNAYCQNNEITHIDWENIDTELLEFCKKLIQTRKNHSAIFNNNFLLGQANPIYPDVIFKKADGGNLSPQDWQNENCVMVYLNHHDDNICIAINRNKTTINTHLIAPIDGNSWNCEFTSAEEIPKILFLETLLAPNSISLFSQTRCENAQTYIVDDDILDRLCIGLGVSPDWWDVNGKQTTVPKSSKIKICEDLGYDCKTNTKAFNSLANLSHKFDLRPLPHVQSFDYGDEIIISHNVPKYSAPYFSDIILNIFSNQEKIIKPIYSQPITKLTRNNIEYFEYSFKLESLECGIYEIAFANDLQTTCRIIIAPKNAYLPAQLETNKVFGLSVQLYSLREEMAKPIGDFSTLAYALKYAKNADAKLLAINPLHALFGANRKLQSPYYPSDRRCLEPIYIDIAQLGGQLNNDFNENFVEYEKIWHAKREFLWQDFCKNKHNSNFIDYCKNAPQYIEEYAIFEAIDFIYQGDWPSDLIKKDEIAIAQFKAQYQKEIDFYKYLQFICESQLKAALIHKPQIGLNGDLAIGAAPNGAEYWGNIAQICRNISIGAPPDPLGPQGQVWGLPPYNPLKIIENKLQIYVDLFNANMKYVDALRIDHAMGLMRQFWVPKGNDGAMGAYVAFPFAHILRLLKLLSHENKCLIIGEDLGTVPHGFSENMQSQNVFSYKLLPFEINQNGFKLPNEYPQNSFTCASTHDLPPIRGWLENIDIITRKSIGIFNQSEFETATHEREQQKQMLIAALIKIGLINDREFLSDDQLIVAIHDFLAKTNAKIAIAQIEDLAGEANMVNLPGTSFEYANWQRKIKIPLEKIFAQENKLSNSILDQLQKHRGN